MPKKKEASSSSSPPAASSPPPPPSAPKLSRPLPPTHIQKVGTQLELEVLVEGGEGAGVAVRKVEKGGKQYL